MLLSQTQGQGFVMKNTALAVFFGAVAIATPAYGDQVITADTSVQGRLERGDSTRNGRWVDTYTYNGEAGEELRIHHGNSGITLTIAGPRGFSQEITHDTAMNVRLPQRGRYRLTLACATYAGPCAYELSVWRVSTDQPPSALTADQTINGGFLTADSPNPTLSHLRQDTYTYTARADEAAVFHFENQHRSYMVVEVIGANNFRRYGTADAGTAGDLNAYFPAAGEYRVLVSGEGGNYTLAVQSRQTVATASADGHVLVGDTVQLSYPSGTALNRWHEEVSVYTFDAQRGERLAVIRPVHWRAEVRSPDGEVLPGNLTVDDATGVMRWEFVAPANGQYRIEAAVAPQMNPAQSTLQLVSTAQGASIMAEARARGERERAEREARIAQLLQRADQLLNSGANEQAVQAFQEVQSLDPYNVNASIGRGVAYFRMGHYGAAEFAFETAVRDDPNNQLAAANLAAARRAQQDQQRQQQAAAEQRERENAQFLSNAVGAAIAGYNAGVAMNTPPPAAPPLSSPSNAAASGERAPNSVLPGDIEEYQRVCLSERQQYGNATRLHIGAGAPGWEELADHWGSQYRNDPGMIEVFWTNNTRSAAELQVPQSYTGLKQILAACAVRVRVAQLRRPMP
jgi:tetratricopeptide (TPR) repeat protein